MATSDSTTGDFNRTQNAEHQLRHLEVLVQQITERLLRADESGNRHFVYSLAMRLVTVQGVANIFHHYILHSRQQTDVVVAGEPVEVAGGSQEASDRPEEADGEAPGGWCADS